MTADDRSRYLTAFQALKKRLERPGLKVTHVRWADGVMSGEATGKELEEHVPEVAPSPRGISLDLFSI